MPLDATPQWIAHSNLFCLTFYRGILAHTMPGVTFGRLLDPAMLSPAQALELASEDIAQRHPDPLDEQFIAILKEEIATRAR